MSTTQRSEAIRIEILTQLYAQRPGTRDVEHIVRMARRENAEFHDLTDFEVTRELDYLRGMERVEKLDGVGRWKITAAGIQWAEEAGLV